MHKNENEEILNKADSIQDILINEEETNNNEEILDSYDNHKDLNRHQNNMNIDPYLQENSNLNDGHDDIEAENYQFEDSQNYNSNEDNYDNEYEEIMVTDNNIIINNINKFNTIYPDNKNIIYNSDNNIYTRISKSNEKQKFQFYYDNNPHQIINDQNNYHYRGNNYNTTERIEKNEFNDLINHKIIRMNVNNNNNQQISHSHNGYSENEDIYNEEKLQISNEIYNNFNDQEGLNSQKRISFSNNGFEGNICNFPSNNHHQSNLINANKTETGNTELVKNLNKFNNKKNTGSKRENSIIENKEEKPSFQYLATNNSLRRAAYLKEGQPDLDEIEISQLKNNSNAKAISNNTKEDSEQLKKKPANTKVMSNISAKLSNGENNKKESETDEYSLLRSLEEKWEKIEKKKKMQTMNHNKINNLKYNLFMREQGLRSNKLDKSDLNKNTIDEKNSNMNFKKNSDESGADLTYLEGNNTKTEKTNNKNIVLNKSEISEKPAEKSLKNNNTIRSSNNNYNNHNFKKSQKNKFFEKDFCNYDENCDINLNIHNKNCTNYNINQIQEVNGKITKQTFKSLNNFKNSSSVNFFNSNSNYNFYDFGKRNIHGDEEEENDELDNFIKEKTRLLNNIKDKNFKLNNYLYENNLQNENLNQVDKNSEQEQNTQNSPPFTNQAIINNHAHISELKNNKDKCRNKFKLNTKLLIDKIFNEENSQNKNDYNNNNTQASGNSGNKEPSVPNTFKNKSRYKKTSITIYEPNLSNNQENINNKKATFLKPMNSTPDGRVQANMAFTSKNIMGNNVKYNLLNVYQEATNLAEENQMNVNTSNILDNNNYVSANNNLKTFGRRPTFGNKLLDEYQNTNFNYLSSNYNEEYQVINNDPKSNVLNKSIEKNYLNTLVQTTKTTHNINYNDSDINNFNDKLSPNVQDDKIFDNSKNNNNNNNLKDKIKSLYSDISKINNITESKNNSGFNSNNVINNYNISCINNNINHSSEMKNKTEENNLHTQEIANYIDENNYNAMKTANSPSKLNNFKLNMKNLTLSNLEKNFEKILSAITPGLQRDKKGGVENLESLNNKYNNRSNNSPNIDRKLKNDNLSSFLITRKSYNFSNNLIPSYSELSNDNLNYNPNSFIKSHFTPSNTRSCMKSFNYFYTDFMESEEMFNPTKYSNFAERNNRFKMNEKPFSLKVKSPIENKIKSKINKNQELLDKLFHKKTSFQTKANILNNKNLDVLKPNKVLIESHPHSKYAELLNSQNFKTTKNSQKKVFNEFSFVNFGSPIKSIHRSIVFRKANSSKFY